MRGSPACAVEPVRHRQETLDLALWREKSEIASSLSTGNCQFSVDGPVYLPTFMADSWQIHGGHMVNGFAKVDNGFG
jgi:hypothetical protein